MDAPQTLPGAETVSAYLAAENDRIKKIVGMVAYNVTAAAKQAAQALINDRDRVSDVTDHLDGEFIAELGMEQAEEIKTIARIGQELQRYFDITIMKLALRDFNEDILRQIRELEKRETSLREREQDIEKVIRKRISELRDQILKDSTTARGFFESALTKAEKVFDQNKITRFAYSAIAVFQEEFFDLQGSNDVERITKLYQRAIEPFQITKMVMDKDGKLKKVVTNQFSEACSQDLFLFFYKYYNELLEIYQTEGELPSSADELARIFQKKKKDISEIISDMQQLDKTP
ncbi:hypothetical protein [Desulfofustis limnaeus]|jgi:hypothetical protein|uniref:Uncharacterized protein n=1 Tax=Desulfofustis limnaeus TaxID=2740163 RepID=A0ABM7WBB7_9BACT|nr:hypothetical protein [Desulfofustis limnaeus]MDX9896180.1 hypothetical protein [Desulfofustis sp.]BDD88166.1 hypothetical protein DPPLL_25310 [Desulfofustis limnaeus]